MTDTALKNPERRVYEPEEVRDNILLSMVDGIGPLMMKRLSDCFENATAVLKASSHDLQQVEGIGPRLADRIVHAPEQYPVDELIALCRAKKIQILIPDDIRYPERLLEISDMPSVLYCRGTLEACDSLAISIVGTRGISYYGRKQTDRLATELVNAGFTIVSGMALGVDGQAHRAAINANGRTLAVLGSGLLEIFPREHESLYHDIIEHGAVLSEFHPHMAPLKGNFPQRNRIVSGLSLGVLVVESPRKSGSLITARLAMEQNRDVFAMPGPVDQENSRGCHRLIKDGAVLVESVDDIIEVLGPLSRPVLTPQSPAPVRLPSEVLLNDREKKVLQFIGTLPTSIDRIIEESGLAAHQVLGVIAALEFRKILRRGEGNSVYRL